MEVRNVRVVWRVVTSCYPHSRHVSCVRLVRMLRVRRWRHVCIVRRVRSVTRVDWFSAIRVWLVRVKSLRAVHRVRSVYRARSLRLNR